MAFKIISFRDKLECPVYAFPAEGRTGSFDATGRASDDARHVQREILEKGVWRRPSAYGDEPYPITRALIEDGRANRLFGTPIRSYCPVHILQGGRDEDVPVTHAMRLMEHFASDPAAITLVKDGDHRLSRPQDLERLAAAVEAVAGRSLP